MEREIHELKTLQDRLNQLDNYALTTVLTHYPTGANRKGGVLDSSIQRATDLFTDHLFEAKKGLQSSLSRRIIKIKELLGQVEGDKKELHEDPDHQKYAKDLEGMFHLHRWDYQAFCGKKNMMPKQEGLEDIFLRKAIAYADGNPDPNTPMLFSGLSDANKAEVKAILPTIPFREIIPSLEGISLEDKFPIPTTATDREKARILQQRTAQAKSDFAEIRQQIRWNVEGIIEEEIFEDTLEELPPEQGVQGQRTEEDIFYDAQEEFSQQQEIQRQNTEEDIFYDALENPLLEQRQTSFFNGVQNAFKNRVSHLGTRLSSLRERIASLRERIDLSATFSYLREKANQTTHLRTRISAIVTAAQQRIALRERIERIRNRLFSHQMQP